jgi:hypothetical protein
VEEEEEEEKRGVRRKGERAEPKPRYAAVLQMYEVECIESRGEGLKGPLPPRKDWEADCFLGMHTYCEAKNYGGPQSGYARGICEPIARITRQIQPGIPEMTAEEHN